MSNREQKSRTNVFEGDDSLEVESRKNTSSQEIFWQSVEAGVKDRKKKTMSKKSNSLKFDHKRYRKKSTRSKIDIRTYRGLMFDSRRLQEEAKLNNMSFPELTPDQWGQMTEEEIERLIYQSIIYEGLAPFIFWRRMEKLHSMTSKEMFAFGKSLFLPLPSTTQGLKLPSAVQRSENISDNSVINIASNFGITTSQNITNSASISKLTSKNESDKYVSYPKKNNINDIATTTHNMNGTLPPSEYSYNDSNNCTSFPTRNNNDATRSNHIANTFMPLASSEIGRYLPVANEIISGDVIIFFDENEGSREADIDLEEITVYTGTLFNSFRYRMKEPVWESSMRWITAQRFIMFIICVFTAIVVALCMALTNANGTIIQVTNTLTSDVSHSPSSYADSSEMLPSVPSYPITWDRMGEDIDDIDRSGFTDVTVAISKDGHRLCVGGTGVLRIYDLTSGEKVRNTWSLVSDLFSSFSKSSKSSPSLSLSSNGRHLIVGDSKRDESVGAVSVFQEKKDNTTLWAQVGATLVGERYGDSFGYSVGITGDGQMITIGVRQFTVGAGYVKVFRCSAANDLHQQQWTLLKRLRDTNLGYLFGETLSVASDGSRLIVGALFDDYNGKNSGSAYIYSLPDVSLIQRIDGDANDRFGSHVAISNDGSCVAVVGVNLVRVFNFHNSTKQYSKIGSGEPIVGIPNTFFGHSLSLSADGSRLAIGAYMSGVGYNGKTLLYAIKKDSWRAIGEIEGKAAGDNSGFSVAINSNGNVVAIAAPGNGGDGTINGHVRVYQSLNAV